MPDITKELITYLKTKSAVTDIVGAGAAARIYEELAKQNVPASFIVLETFTGNSYECLGAIAGVAMNRIQIDCYGQTADAAFALAEAVRLAPLQKYRGAMGSAFVTDVNSDQSYRKGFDNAISGGNQRRWWVSRDYEISYAEPTTV